MGDISCTSRLLLIQPSRPACSVRVLVQTRGNENVRARPVTQQCTTNRPFSHRVYLSHTEYSLDLSLLAPCVHYICQHYICQHGKEHYDAADAHGDSRILQVHNNTPPKFSRAARGRLARAIGSCCCRCSAWSMHMIDISRCDAVLTGRPRKRSSELVRKVTVLSSLETVL